MVNVTITTETAEALFRDILVQDYRGLKAQKADLESRLDSLHRFEKEDLEANTRWLNAIETMMEYYIPHHEMVEILNETTN